MSTIDLSRFAFSKNSPTPLHLFEVHTDDSCFVFTTWEQAALAYQEELSNNPETLTLIGIQND